MENNVKIQDDTQSLQLCVSDSLIGRKIKHWGIEQTITDVNETGIWVTTDKSPIDGIYLMWDSVEWLW